MWFTDCNLPSMAVTGKPKVWVQREGMIWIFQISFVELDVQTEWLHADYVLKG